MVKYDPVLGAFRTIDDGSVSLNGNTDTIFAGSGLLMSINETGFQTNWSPNFTINTNLSDVLFSVMQRFDNDEFANAVAHLDFVRRLDALENGNSGGAANIAVNGVSPDAAGNIQLNAEDISFNLKDSMGDDIPTSPAISNINLQDFFKTIQYAIFSVNGHCAYIDPSNPIAVQGDISIYGNTMYLITKDDALPGSDWDGNPLNEKTVYDLAYDVYTHSVKEISTDGGETYSTAENGKLNLTIKCPASGWVAGEYGAEFGTYISLTDILDQLSRKSIRTINNNAVDDEDTGNINIYAGDLLMRSSSSEEDYPPTVYDGLYTADFYKMGVPIYQSYAVLDCESNTDYYTESTGYILLELGVRDGEVPSVPFLVTINDMTVAAIIPAAGTRQTFMFPCPTGASWRCDTPGLPFEFVSIQFIPGEHSMY